jgi:hypothetical protein
VWYLWSSNVCCSESPLLLSTLNLQKVSILSFFYFYEGMLVCEVRLASLSATSGDKGSI